MQKANLTVTPYLAPRPVSDHTIRMAKPAWLPLLPILIGLGLAVWSGKNALLWLLAGLGLAACVLALNSVRRFPLLSVVAVAWFGIASDILSADLAGQDMSDSIGGSYRPYVVVLALLSLVIMAWGSAAAMRVADRRSARPRLLSARLDFRFCMFFYVAAFALKSVLAIPANMLPSLSQPILGFAKIHLVAVFLLYTCIFKTNKHYGVAVAVFLVEAVIGNTGFISSFQPVAMTILLAGLCEVSATKAKDLVRLGLIVAGMLTFATIWTAMKPAYRDWVSGGTNEQIVTRSLGERVAWIGSWLFTDSGRAEPSSQASDPLVALLQRMGYTAFFALAAERADSGVASGIPPRWESGILHVLTPRFLFDKPVLDDSLVTTALTGVQFGKTASVSIGYVAEAFVDFGFPLMLLPIFALGALLGWVNGYFETRPHPDDLNRAFAVAALAFTFQFGGNVDKEFGGFIVGVIALALTLKLLGPVLEMLLFVRGVPNGIVPPSHSLVGMRRVGASR